MSGVEMLQYFLHISNVSDLLSWAKVERLWSCFFPPQRLETDLSYWMDHARSSDQGRQHHYDENSPIGPRDRGAHRHGADVNYDYY